MFPVGGEKQDGMIVVYKWTHIPENRNSLDVGRALRKLCPPDHDVAASRVVATVAIVQGPGFEPVCPQTLCHCSNYSNTLDNWVAYTERFINISIAGFISDKKKTAKSNESNHKEYECFYKIN